MGVSLKVIGRGVRSHQLYRPVLSAAPISVLRATPPIEPMDGNTLRHWLGVKSARLGLAYDFNPYFCLSIASVDRCTASSGQMLAIA